MPAKKPSQIAGSQPHTPPPKTPGGGVRSTPHTGFSPTSTPVAKRVKTEPAGSAFSSPTLSAATETRDPLKEPFYYWYLTSDGRRRREKVNASQEDIESLLHYRIEFVGSQLKHPWADRVRLRTDQDDAGFVTGYLADRDSLPVCPGYKQAYLLEDTSLCKEGPPRISLPPSLPLFTPLLSTSSSSTSATPSKPQAGLQHHHRSGSPAASSTSSQFSSSSSSGATSQSSFNSPHNSQEHSSQGSTSYGSSQESASASTPGAQQAVTPGTNKNRVVLDLTDEPTPTILALSPGVSLAALSAAPTAAITPPEKQKAAGGSEADEIPPTTPKGKEKDKETSQLAATPVVSTPVVPTPVGDAGHRLLTTDLKETSFVLLVDPSELLIVGNTQETAYKALTDRKIACDQRNLPFGKGFAWVARRKEGGEEVMLDSYLLIMPIGAFLKGVKDGSLQNLRFRLAVCGLNQITIIVDCLYQYNEVGILFPGPVQDQFQQAINDLQVHNNIFVKLSTSAEETAYFIHVMTLTLRKNYLRGTLHAVDGTIASKKELEVVREDYRLKNPGSKILITYRQFEALTTRSRPTSIGELFLRQLQLVSVDRERAEAIAGKYPTLAALRRAYSALHDKKQREEMLTNITIHPDKKKVGIQVSKRIYSLYCEFS